jgi:hypothetical protein
MENWEPERKAARKLRALCWALRRLRAGRKAVAAVSLSSSAGPAVILRHCCARRARIYVNSSPACPLCFVLSTEICSGPCSPCLQKQRCDKWLSRSVAKSAGMAQGHNGSQRSVWPSRAHQFTYSNFGGRLAGQASLPVCRGGWRASAGVAAFGWPMVAGDEILGPAGTAAAFGLALSPRRTQHRSA